MSKAKIILASNSAARRKILSGAGINFMSISPVIDERSYPLLPEQSFADYAVFLAQEKAKSVCLDNPNSYVIGSDQLLVFEDRIIHKSPNLDSLKDTLMLLRGKPHNLISSAAICYNGDVIFDCYDQATLTMWNFPDTFLDKYIQQEGEVLLSSVGGYFYEGSGCQLFESTDGDFFTILGLPVFPLLSYLRQHKLIDTA